MHRRSPNTILPILASAPGPGQRGEAQGTLSPRAAAMPGDTGAVWLGAKAISREKYYWRRLK